ncbi:MAG TPA: alpha/beta hydrolase [Pseudolysinimonas sp.]|nr:alpha/beta hydrolase [Pseudolysinimonas sp.]
MQRFFTRARSGLRWWFSRRSRIVLTAIVAVVAALSVWTNATPWPSAMLIRAVFEQGGAATSAELARHVPDVEFDEQLDQSPPQGTGAPYDVIRTAESEGPQPTVIWVHGGAWISGDKSNVDGYLRILAAEGYTTVSLGYTVAPEAAYPTAIRQLSQSIEYLLDNAGRYGVDTTRIVLAGDSAGAQLASQLAAMATNPDYELLVGVDSALEADQLAGVVLNCGVYELDGMAKLTGIGAWGFKIALWAYTGTKDWSQEAPGALMSTLEFATPDFPPTYISGGNGDALTWVQSVPMANRLDELGVDVTRVFYPADHEPALPHEYQFHLDGEDARDALSATLQFLERVTR